MEKLPLSEADYAHLARLLHKVDFFAPLTVGQMEKILPYILLYRFPKGGIVFRQGEIGDAFYVLYDGEARARVRGFLGLPRELARFKTGDFFGEMALLSKEPRSATVECLEESRLFVLLFDDFQYVLRENPSFAEEIRRTAARRKFLSARGR